MSARDKDGHGTHPVSTSAGSIVTDVSLLGMAKGTARGGAPGARVVIYKACWFDMCSDADLLSAMDDAIYDGVIFYRFPSDQTRHNRFISRMLCL